MRTRKIAGKISYLKAGSTVLLAVYGVICLRSVVQGSFLDRVDLIAHEAGHLLFGYFGEFLRVAGGTLGQLLVPAGIAAYFAARREFYSASVVLFWVGQSLLNVSVYLKDAAVMELPLVSVGGGDSIHDWNWLLLKFNVLAHDQTIGNLVAGAGALVILASIALAGYFSFDKSDQVIAPGS
jgi:hypothetical protein